MHMSFNYFYFNWFVKLVGIGADPKIPLEYPNLMGVRLVTLLLSYLKGKFRDSNIKFSQKMMGLMNVLSPKFMFKFNRCT